MIMAELLYSVAKLHHDSVDTVLDRFDMTLYISSLIGVDTSTH